MIDSTGKVLHSSSLKTEGKEQHGSIIKEKLSDKSYRWNYESGLVERYYEDGTVLAAIKDGVTIIDNRHTGLR